MLKALELSGFKSFADRTRFEFPKGVSVVVGPNGSGKSNLVDAVKWVLGSQSAKSLRGKEMTDVIFNGAASRGPIGTAEATLTLDNQDGQLAIDAREVHVTRRVYRSGEGEYLINRQPCRLRDIRDLLAGTGITTEAYCIIEQGKVDMLLQSSPRDRRLIFEEAAGISQFKAKKAAAARRLEHVEQNLLRLSDIVDEVESRLRSVRMQAGKARRYRDHAQRLQDLRTQVGLVDWRALSKEIADRDEHLAALTCRGQEREAALARAETGAGQAERQLEAAARRSREIEAAASATREQIAAHQASIDSGRARRADLEQEIARFRRQLTAMSTRAGSATAELHDAATQLRAVEDEFAAVQDQLQQHMTRLRDAQDELRAEHAALEQCRARHAEAVRSAALLANQFDVLESQRTTARATGDAHRQQIEELARTHDACAKELAEHERREAELAVEVGACQAELRQSEGRLAGIRHELARVDKACRQLEARLTRCRERIAVLTELEQRLAGLDSGPGQVLRMARSAPAGPLGDVLGVVADLFHVDVDSAPLVEVALGEHTQFVVLRSAGRLLDWLETQPLGVTGRVGFLRLDFRPPDAALDHVDLSAEPGVMGRADQFVETSPELVPLVRRLLGRTWLVDRLSTALRLAQTTGRGLAFVSSDGQLFSADGTLVVGPRQAPAGMLSRRSELRACHEQIAEWERQLETKQSLQARLEQQRTEHEQIVSSCTEQHTALMTKLAEQRHGTTSARGRMEQAVQSLGHANQELQVADGQIRAIEQDLALTRRRQLDAQAAANGAEHEAQTGADRAAEIDQRLTSLRADATARQIAAAKWEERVDMLRGRVEQAHRNQQERDQALDDMRRRLAARQTQLEELDRAMLAGGQVLAELYLRKEQYVEELSAHAAEEESLREQRTALMDEIRRQRHELSTIQSQRHRLEIAASKLRHERQTLAERMQDDYGIDLSEAASAAGTAGEAASAAGPLGDRDAVEREIAELRRQLNNIGAVNLDALDELEELESRFGKLSQQYRDLVDAKASLERIIQRINADSRQLFLATLDVVRGHFQDLFRRLFGGGEADILLDDDEDVLECGIEIVARPPGKEKCSISLLSGGEKTLTCVALLLAVFRSKPSPFCVLDEVDAALDESNIGRFIGVLREFLSFTQFVVISHSKRTMAGADTLYGITMQESGVSKQVSVRFEDVSEDGQISIRGRSSSDPPAQRLAA
jgi:chromosome segregation protein